MNGRVDPVADIETINTELALADLGTVTRALDRATRGAKTGDKDLRRQQAFLERVQAHLDEARPARALELDRDEAERIQRVVPADPQAGGLRRQRG